MNRKTKGAITVFMVIVYIWVFILMGVLVDGGRVRLAIAEAEQAQQLANESMLTYYNNALYDYYDLFGESRFSAEEMQPKVQEIIKQTMGLDVNGDLKEVMDSKFIGTLSGKSYADLFGLDVSSTVGSSLNLANDDVFKCQINDSMKYAGPLILANGFLDMLSSLQGVGNTVKAVKSCTDEVSGITERISDYQKRIEEMRRQLYYFCEDPKGNYKGSKKESCDDSKKYNPDKDAQTFDREAKKAVENFDLKVEENLKALQQGKDALKEQKEGETLEQAQQRQAEEEAHKTIDALIDRSYNNFITEIQSVITNVDKIKGEIEVLRNEGQSLSDAIRGRSSGLLKQKNGKDVSTDEIYDSFSNSLLKSADSVQQTANTLNDLLQILEKMRGSMKPTWMEFKSESQKLKDALKKDYLTDLHEMDRNPTVRQYFNNFCNTRDIRLLPQIDDLEIAKTGDEKIKEAEDKVKEAQSDNKNGADGEKSVSKTKRLGKVKQIETSENDIEKKKSTSYNRKNAGKEADANMGMITNVLDTLGDVGGSIMNNLFEDAYILSNFRDYVHTYEMVKKGDDDTAEYKGSQNTTHYGEERYDTVANAKFGIGDKDTGMRAEDYQAIETTCAEIEYILFGDTDTRKDVLGAYSSIYAFRLALDYASVWMIPTFRNTVIQASEAANIGAPLVLLLMPFAYALPRAAFDVKLIMEGKTMPLIYQGDDYLQSWYIPGEVFESCKTRAGYSDYLMLMLTTMNQTKKVDRMQDLIQMNMQKVDADFTLEKALVNVYVDSEFSVKYLFMTQMFMPTNLRMDGKYKFKVATNVSY